MVTTDVTRRMVCGGVAGMIAKVRRRMTGHSRYPFVAQVHVTDSDKSFGTDQNVVTNWRRNQKGQRETVNLGFIP
jgi:hypothetical protein